MSSLSRAISFTQFLPQCSIYFEQMHFLVPNQKKRNKDTKEWMKPGRKDCDSSIDRLDSRLCLFISLVNITLEPNIFFVALKTRIFILLNSFMRIPKYLSDVQSEKRGIWNSWNLFLKMGSIVKFLIRLKKGFGFTVDLSSIPKGMARHLSISQENIFTSLTSIIIPFAI